MQNSAPLSTRQTVTAINAETALIGCYNAERYNLGSET